MGNPPELHSHFSVLHQYPRLDEALLANTVAELLDDVGEVELTLSKAQLQTRNKQLDSEYYKSLVANTETEIAQCGAEIAGLKQDLEDQLLLKKQKADFEAICCAINEFPPAQDTQKLILESRKEQERLKDACSTDEINRKQKQLNQIVSLLNEFRQDALKDQQEQEADAKME